MHGSRSRLAIASLLALASCDISLYTFLVPAQIGAGQLFEVDITGQANNQPQDPVGVILQLPLGFAVEAATAVATQGGTQVLLSDGGRQAAPPTLVTPEPGHHVVGFAGSMMLGYYATNLALKVYVRAPATTGTFQIKIALLGTSGVQPAGATSFAAITAAPFVQSLTVLGYPVLPFHAQMLPVPAPAPMSAEGVALGDVDGDGLDDLVCFAPGSGLPSGIWVWQNRPATNWTPLHPPTTTFGYGSTNVAFGDFDGDGHRDLVDCSGRVLFGDGGLGWTPGPALPLLIPEWAGVAVGDIDGDGQDDVAFSAWLSDAVQVFRSGSNRTFADWSGTLPNATNGPTGAHRLALEDVNGDGRCDLVVAGAIGLRAWLGDGLGHWTDVSTGLPYAFEFALGDMDVDGVIDVVVGGCCGDRLVLEYSVAGWQQRTMAVPGQVLGYPLAVLDYDRDGWPDLCVGASLLRSLGGQSFAPPVALVTSLWPVQPQGIAVGDLDGDTWPDLAVTFDGLPPVLLFNTGSGLSPYGSSCSAPGLPTPHTVGIGQPTLGNASFAIGLEGALPNGLGLLWIGLDNRFAFGAPLLPYDLASHGAPGCAVVASTEAPTFVLADGSGHASVLLPIPNAAALRRVVVFAQGAAAVPGANALGWLFSNGLAVKIP